MFSSFFFSEALLISASESWLISEAAQPLAAYDSPVSEASQSRAEYSDDEILSQLYFARYGLPIALYEAWHSDTLRCHAFYITACLLCAASFSSCILLDLLCLNQLLESILRLFYFSSCSVILASEIAVVPWFQQLLGALGCIHLSFR